MPPGRRLACRGPRRTRRGGQEHHRRREESADQDDLSQGWARRTRRAVGLTKLQLRCRAEGSGRSSADQRRYERNVSDLFRLPHTSETCPIRDRPVSDGCAAGMNRPPPRLESRCASRPGRRRPPHDPLFHMQNRLHPWPRIGPAAHIVLCCPSIIPSPSDDDRAAIAADPSPAPAAMAPPRSLPPTAPIKEVIQNKDHV